MGYGQTGKTFERREVIPGGRYQCVGLGQKREAPPEVPGSRCLLVERGLHTSLLPLAFERRTEHLSDVPNKLYLVCCEHAPPDTVCTKHPEEPACRADPRTYAADHPMVPE